MSRFKLFLETAKGAFKPNLVQYLIFFVSSRCNSKCKMCFNFEVLDSKKGSDELSLEEIEAIAKNLPSLIQLTLSGGEPFLRDDLVEIVSLFHKYSNIRQLTLPTNGILTDRIREIFPEILKKFPELNVNLDISIDAIGNAHNEIRGVPDAYEKAIESYKLATEWRERYKNMRLGMQAVLSFFNQDKIIELLEHTEKEFSFDRRQVMLARGFTRDPKAKDVSFEIYQKAHQWITQHDKKTSQPFFSKVNYHLAVMVRETLIKSLKENRMIIPCLAGRKLAIIDADGTVRACEVLHCLYPNGRRDYGLDDFILGRARDEDYNITKIINSEKAKKVRKFIKESRCYCTFECAIFNNIVFNPLYWTPLLMRILFKN